MAETNETNGTNETNETIVTGELVEKIISKLTELLQREVDDDEMFDVIKPIIPALVKLGIDEGIGTAEAILKGLTTDDPYPYWRSLIKVSDWRTRIQLMENARQAAIQDRIKKLEQERARWEAFKVVMKVVVSLLGLLLL